MDAMDEAFKLVVTGMIAFMGMVAMAVSGAYGIESARYGTWQDCALSTVGVLFGFGMLALGCFLAVQPL